MANYIDLTHKLTSNMPVFTESDTFNLNTHKHLDKDGYQDELLQGSMHIGTHIDAPSHMLDSDKTVIDYPLNQLIGNASFINVVGEQLIDYKKEYEDLINDGDIVVVYTNHSQYFGKKQYFQKHPILTETFVDLLIRKEIKMLCLDTPSPDKAPFNLHKKLLRERIGIVENLTNLKALITYDSIKIYIMPLKLKTSGAYARVIADVK
ncbi:MAG: cyclase family protein [Halanaerobiales bacterium]|nr:cyclase family protein [Halanaerobiales bacterium]